MHGKAVALATGRNDRQKKDHNPHTAQPMGETTPVEHAIGHCLHIGKNGCSRCGKAGNRLKICINKCRDLTGNKKRHTADQTHDRPAQTRTDQSFSGIKTHLCPTTEHKHKQSYKDRSYDRCCKCRNGSRLAVDQTNDPCRHHKDRFRNDHEGHETSHHLIVHTKPRYSNLYYANISFNV